MEYYEEDILAQTLKEMIEITKDVETRKNHLALRSDFSMHDFYAIFDVENKGSISLREFTEVFDMFRIYPPGEYIRLTFRLLDRDLDGKLTLKEFLEGLAPKDKNYRDLVLERASYNDGTNFSRINSFTPDTQREFIAFLKSLVEGEHLLEKVRLGLTLRNNFDVKSAYKSLDKAQKGHVNLEDIRLFLTNRYLFATDMEIQYLFDRMDVLKCGQISLNEFIREMRPKLI